MAKKTFNPEGWSYEGGAYRRGEYIMWVFPDESDPEWNIEIHRGKKMIFYGSIPKLTDFPFLCKLLNIK